MIFVVINIIICAILVYISFSIDKNVKGNSSNASLVNLFFFLGVIFLFMAITIILCLDNSVQHTLLSNPDGTQSLHVELHNSFSPAAVERYGRNRAFTASYSRVAKTFLFMCLNL